MQISVQVLEDQCEVADYIESINSLKNMVTEARGMIVLNACVLNVNDTVRFFFSFPSFQESI